MSTIKGFEVGGQTLLYEDQQLAEEFSTSKTYPVGSYVLYDGDGLLYECHTAVTTAGAWTGNTNWIHAVLANETRDLKNTLKVNFKDLNSYNLLDNFDKHDKDNHGVKWEWNGESVYAHGTATAIANLDIFSSSSSIPEGFTAGETYKVKYNSTNITLRIYDYTSSAVQIASFKNDGEFTIPETCQGLIIRLGIANGANVNETVTPIIYNIATNTELYNSIETLKHNAGTIKEILDEKKEYFEQGGINASGENTDYGKSARIRPVMIHKAIDVFSLYVSTSNYPNAAMYIHFYDENGGYVGNSNAWITEYTFTKGEIFRIVLTLDKTSTSRSFTIDEIFDEIFTNNTTSRIVKMVSHQGNVNSDNNQCKVAGYKLAGKSGFDYGECDIKFTSDDVPVCCHDGTFVDSVSGQTIVIASTTYANLIQYNYYGGTIASLDDVVKACKEANIGLYIDQYGNSISAGRVQAVFDVLNKYRFVRNVKHIIYSETPALRILDHDPHAWIIAGQSHSSPDATAAIALANAIKTEDNKVDVMLWQGLGANVIETALRSMNPEYGLNIYRCDSREEKIAMMSYATSITTNMSSSLYIE